jgi:hypothetical protein
MKKVIFAGLLIGMMLVAWLLKVVINVAVVGGEVITFGHTLGLVVGLTAIRLIFDYWFEK